MFNLGFDFYNNQNEKNLLNDLMSESVSIYGHDIYYLPRELINKDDIYGEDTVSEYNENYFLRMYIRSYDNFQGDGSFLSKFNLEIRDQMVFTVSQRDINDQLNVEGNIRRPQEGDLIYSTMMKRIFVVEYVNKEALFYQLGDLQAYDLTCEVWEYSNEKLRTGIEEIDRLEEKYSFDIEEQGFLTADDFIILDSNGFGFINDEFDYDTQLLDVFADNDEISEEAVPIVDWSETNPFQDPI